MTVQRYRDKRWEGELLFISGLINAVPLVVSSAATYLRIVGRGADCIAERVQPRCSELLRGSTPPESLYLINYLGT